MFWDKLELFGSRIALIEHGTSLSYGELAKAADRCFDVPRGTLLLLSLDNSLSSVVALMGALRRRLPAIIINADEEERAAGIVEAFRPAARWSPSEGQVRLRPEDALSAVHPDLALLLSTSGTTGSAKLVRLSHGAVDANARSIGGFLGIDTSERAITTLPPAYSYGLSILTSHLAAGASVVLYGGSVIEPAFRSTVAELDVTSLGGVPYTYELLERTGFLQHLPASIRTLTQAGGKMPVDRVRRVAEWTQAADARFVVMYGQTEATARMAFVPPDLLANHPDCIGRPIPGGRFELVDPATGLPASGSGELVYSGPNVMMGYAESAADLSRGHETHRLRTGDLAEQLPSGLYRIVGRKNRFIKPFGRRICLEEVERLLAERGVAAAVTGDDHRLVIGVLSSEAATVADRIVQERLKLPSGYLCVLQLSEFPRLASGKIDYNELKRHGRLSHSADPATDEASTPDTAFRRAFAQAIGRDRVSGNESFKSLAGDSLSYIQASLAIEDAVGHLPENWEELTISQIEALASERSVEATEGRSSRWLSTDVLIRPICIGLVVAAHVVSESAKANLQGGALTLLILCGFSFCRFQGDRLLSEDRASILASFLLRFIAPYYVVLAIYDVFSKNDIGLASLLLVNNIIRDPGVTGMVAFWFIQALFHCTIVMVLLFSMPAVRRFAVERSWLFGWTLLGGALLLKTAGDYIHGSSSERYGTDAWAYAFALGWIVANARTSWQRAAALVATILATAAAWGFFDSHTVIAGCAVAAILFRPRVKLWKPAADGVAFLAQTTFFAYLMQGIAIHIVTQRLGLPAVAFSILATAALGCASYMAWHMAGQIMPRAAYRLLRFQAWPRTRGNRLEV